MDLVFRGRGAGLIGDGREHGKVLEMVVVMFG